MEFGTIIKLIPVGVTIFSVLVAVSWGFSIATAPSPPVGAERAGEAVTYYAIPWWIKAVEFVKDIPAIGGLLVVGIVGYVAWSRKP